jgi:hypothetical protein
MFFLVNFSTKVTMWWFLFVIFLVDVTWVTNKMILHSSTSLLSFFSCVHCNEMLLLFTNVKHGSVFLCLQILWCIVCKAFSIMHILCFQHANYTRWFFLFTPKKFIIYYSFMAFFISYFLCPCAPAL